jgi:hypothetical protein
MGGGGSCYLRSQQQGPGAPIVSERTNYLKTWATRHSYDGWRIRSDSAHDALRLSVMSLTRLTEAS